MILFSSYLLRYQYYNKILQIFLKSQK